MLLRADVQMSSSVYIQLRSNKSPYCAHCLLGLPQQI